MTKAADSTCLMPVNPDLQKAAETFYESSMASWCLGWHATLLSKYLYSKRCQGPVFEAVIRKLHGVIQRSHQTLAHGALVAIAAQRRLIGCRCIYFSGLQDLRCFILASPFIDSCLFEGQFMSSMSTYSQEQLSQVKHLMSTGSNAAS